MVPFWAKDLKIGSKMVNARAETVHEKPSFRTPFTSRRALIPVDAFYEWLESEQVGKGGKPLKQPFALRPADGSTLALPGRPAATDSYPRWGPRSRSWASTCRPSS
nr:SOS response-associated peptidase family protein [Kribbella flavida]